MLRVIGVKPHLILVIYFSAPNHSGNLGTSMCLPPAIGVCASAMVTPISRIILHTTRILTHGFGADLSNAEDATLRLIQVAYYTDKSLNWSSLRCSSCHPLVLFYQSYTGSLAFPPLLLGITFLSLTHTR